MQLQWELRFARSRCQLPWPQGCGGARVVPWADAWFCGRGHVVSNTATSQGTVGRGPHRQGLRFLLCDVGGMRVTLLSCGENSVEARRPGVMRGVSVATLTASPSWLPEPAFPRCEPRAVV